jgi:hypothetical protein
MAKSQSVALRLEKPKVSRPNVHAKTKTSNSKNSAKYKKKYRGQGR